MPPRASDPLLVHDIATDRYGGLDLICRGCGHIFGWPLDERHTRCSQCRAVNAVCAGTILHRTKIPLWCWKDLLERLDLRLPPPTCREAARKYDIAVSSAWHMLIRAFRLIVRQPLSGDVETLTLYLRCRRPKKPMSELAPERIKALDPDPGWVPVTFQLAGAVAVHVDVGTPGPRPVSADARSFASWLGRAMGRRRRVSLRWLPYWAAAWAAHWTRSAPPYPPPVPWSSRVANSRPHPLHHGLDPWWVPVSAPADG